MRRYGRARVCKALGWVGQSLRSSPLTPISKDMRVLESCGEAPRSVEQVNSHYVGHVCFIDRLPGLSIIPDRPGITTMQEESELSSAHSEVWVESSPAETQIHSADPDATGARYWFLVRIRVRAPPAAPQLPHCNHHIPEPLLLPEDSGPSPSQLSLCTHCAQMRWWYSPARVT